MVFSRTWFLSPDEFIPLFEKSGFIIELDFYMLKKRVHL
ncbi:putative signaling domain protein [Clostridioides difficile DA00165]|nr:putative signaling domain protein [Clostridioides difficile DA00165]